MSTSTKSSSSWEALGLEKRVSEFVVKEFGFEEPTEIQKLTIPQMLGSKDVLVEATTGSGKTLAFVLPVVQILLKQKYAGTSALIISPTRELSEQSAQIVERICSAFGLRCAIVTGGTVVSADVEKLKTAPNILVATPGRLEDLSQRMPGLLKNLEVLVLDEADRLLDLGFSQAISKVLSKAPKQRRTGLFSATLKHTMEDEYSYLCLRNPLKISLRDSVPQTLDNYFAFVGEEEKLSVLVHLLKSDFKDKKVLVFFATCAMVDYFMLLLEEKDVLSNCVALHGKMVPKKRHAVYTKFCSTPGMTLFCTDLAARGLDFSDIDVVVQFDAPKDPRSFAHRCGRTARAGRPGLALMLLHEKEDPFVYLIQNRGIRLEEYPQISGVRMLDLRWKLRADRELFEKSKIALVSFVRHYREHLAKYIFRLEDLDMGKLASGFSLIQLPKMPELQNGKKKSAGTNFEADCTIPYDDIPFKDTVREAARLNKKAAAASLKTTAVVIPNNTIKNTKSWSKGVAKKEGKSVFNKSKILKKLKDNTVQEKIKVTENEDDEMDMKELHDDYKEYKASNKKGKK